MKCVDCQYHKCMLFLPENSQTLQVEMICWGVKPDGKTIRIGEHLEYETIHAPEWCPLTIVEKGDGI